MQCSLLAGLADELKLAQKQISELKSEAARAQLPLLVSKAETTASGAKLLAVQVEGMDAKSLQVVISQVPDDGIFHAVASCVCDGLCGESCKTASEHLYSREETVPKASLLPVPTLCPSICYVCMITSLRWT